jgi:hypothetical protein
MRCTKRYAAFFAATAVVALVLLSAKTTPAADRSAKQNDFWSEGAPSAGGPIAQLAQARPRGGPRDGDDDRPLGPRRMGPDGDGGRPGGMPGGPLGPPESPGGMGMGMMGGVGFGPTGPHGPPEMMKDIDPEMYKLLKEDKLLELQSRELAMEYRRAPSDARAKIKQQVEELVNKHFEVRQQRRSLELKHLEEALNRLRDTMERRAAARKDLVEKRVDDLIGREEELSF